MEGGWIRLHRKMRQWQYYQCPSIRLVFEELLFCANSSDVWFHGERIGRGETVVGVRTISDYTGYSVRIVVDALKKLVESGEIKREKCWRGIKTTIINYEKYQTNSVLESETLSETESETLSETESETLSETEQEYIKNNKKQKKDIDANASSSGAAAPDPDLSSQESVDFVGLVKFFNRTMEEAGAIIPRCKSCDGKRREFVRARIREHGLNAVYEMITKASQSDFLNGKSRSGWIADFTWLFRPSNFQKVLEGNYDNRNNNYQPQINGTNQFTDQRRAERERLARGYAAVIARLAAEDDARAAEVRQSQ